MSLTRIRGVGLGRGDPGRYVKKLSGYGHLSPWGPFPSKGNLVCGGARIPGTSIDE